MLPPLQSAIERELSFGRLWSSVNPAGGLVRIPPAGSRALRSKIDLQPELDDAGRSRGCDGPEIRGAEGGGRDPEIGPVQGIEEFAAELQLPVGAVSSWSVVACPLYSNPILKLWPPR
jgi:hypothetical protein